MRFLWEGKTMIFLSPKRLLDRCLKVVVFNAEKFTIDPVYS